MIVVALLLAGLGCSDLVRSRTRDPASPLAPTVAGVAVFALGVAGTGLDWWWYPVGALAVAAWVVTTTPFAAGVPAAGSRRAHRVAYWAMRVLGIAVVAAFATGAGVDGSTGWFSRWYDDLPYAALDGVSFATFALAAGGVLFLVETANVVVRAALRATGSDTEPADPPALPVAPRERWWSRRGAPLGQVAELAPLKGGRFIGPLERVFLLTLALAGEYTAIAAVVAAKGIIRFPEISRDDTGGSKAEYFLVGSFASWGLVLVVVVAVRLVSIN
jgi:hypothetical protein